MENSNLLLLSPQPFNKVVIFPYICLSGRTVNSTINCIGSCVNGIIVLWLFLMIFSSWQHNSRYFFYYYYSLRLKSWRNWQKILLQQVSLVLKGKWYFGKIISVTTTIYFLHTICRDLTIKTNYLKIFLLI